MKKLTILATSILLTSCSITITVTKPIQKNKCERIHLLEKRQINDSIYEEEFRKTVITPYRYDKFNPQSW